MKPVATPNAFATPVQQQKWIEAMGRFELKPLDLEQRLDVSKGMRRAFRKYPAEDRVIKRDRTLPGGVYLAMRDERRALAALVEAAFVLGVIYLEK